MTRKPLPIGISDFKELIDGGFAYIDKTLLIEEILKLGPKVFLIPRPRRFGKTLNLSMLRYFFEKGKEDMSHLFTHLQIWKDEKMRSLQGQFPVIFLSLKDIKYESWTDTFEALRSLIAKEFQRHDYLTEGDALRPEEKAKYEEIVRETGKQALLGDSLSLLTEWLARYHKKKIFLLIDEYDTPAHAAYLGGYYESFIIFLRNWLSGGLKDNSYLEKGVLTGVLRIAKESIFSGANNISTFTILDSEFHSHFGLLESEVEALLKEYGLSQKLEEIRQWYDGYRIGSYHGIYNPWSVLNCILKKGALAPYWVNTSDNALMKQLITQGAEDLKTDMEELLQGKIIQKNLDDGILFSDLSKSSDKVWSLLLFSGYVSLAESPSYGVPCSLRLPNTEVTLLYTSMIINWFKETIREPKYRMLLDSLKTGDIDAFSQIFQEFVLSSFSMFDLTQKEPEKVYHAFVLGMIVGLQDSFEIKSNRESGFGRYDVLLIPKNPENLGIIMEFKKVATESELETAAISAIEQIEKMRYGWELFDRGIARSLYLGIAFSGKKVLIRHKFTRD